MTTNGRGRRSGTLSVIWTLLCAAYTAAASCTAQSNPLLAIALLVAASFLLLQACDDMLDHKRASHELWWRESAEDFAAFVERHGREPGRRESEPRDAAAGIWAGEVRRIAAERGLTPTELAVATGAGIAIDRESAPAECTEWKSWGSPLSFACCLLCLVATCAASALCAGAFGSPVPTCLMCCVAVTCLVMSAVDLSSRLIPFELCIVLGVFALAFRISSYGIDDALVSLALGAGIALLMGATSALLSRGGRPDAIGAGDLRMTVGVICACGTTGVLGGGLAFAIAFAAWFAVAAALGVADRKTQVPMAPFLTIWAFAGMAIPPLCAAFA